MNLLSDVITYVRRLIKSPSNTVITDNLIIDYINRFWTTDVSARIQVYDLKTQYQFQTIAGLCDYSMPCYSIQTEPGSQSISYYPVYQGFEAPAFCNGIEVPFYTSKNSFYNIWPDYVQALTPVATGDGTTQTFQFTLPFFPAIPGYLDMAGILAWAQQDGSVSPTGPIFADSFPESGGYINIPSTSFYPRVYIVYTNENGSNTTITDSGVFLDSGTGQDLYGLLMEPGNPPRGNTSIGTYTTAANTVNYNTGVVNITFPSAPADNTQIQAQCYFYEQGLPRAALFYNNCITLRNPPNTQYLITIAGYLTPAAFLSTADAVPYAYMSEYLARGAARKILADFGDVEQFQFYEPLFIEQERLVWKRSQRQFTATRTPTIYSGFGFQSYGNNLGQGTN